MPALPQKTLKKKLFASHMVLALLGMVLFVVAIGTILLIQSASLKVINESQPKMEAIDHLGNLLQVQSLQVSELLHGDRRDLVQLETVSHHQINLEFEKLSRMMQTSSLLDQELFAELEASNQELSQYQGQFISLLEKEDKSSFYFLWQNRIFPFLSRPSTEKYNTVLSPSLVLFQEKLQELKKRISTLSGKNREYEPLLEELETLRAVFQVEKAKAEPEAAIFLTYLIDDAAQISQELHIFQKFIRTEKDAPLLVFWREYLHPLEQQTSAHVTALEKALNTELEESVQSMQNVINTGLTIFTVLVLALLGIALLFAQKSAAHILQPIQALLVATRRFADGDLEEDIPEIFDGELGALTVSFNEMRASILKNAGGLEAIFRAAADGIFTLERDGIIWKLNDSMATMLDTTRDELRGNKFLDYLTEISQGRFEAFCENLYQDEADVASHPQVEVTGITKTGERIPLQISLSVVVLEVGVLVVGIMRNISVEKALQKQLIEARDQALGTEKMKSSFLANMSHEIRTPMNGIIGMTDLALATDLNPEQIHYIQIANQGAKSLLGLLNSLLDLSKLEGKKFELETLSFQLLPLLEQVVTNFSVETQSKHIEIILQVDPIIPFRYEGDASRIQQVLMNLLGNAVKFTAKGYVLLKVTGEEVHADQVDLRFDIIDTGIGIPENRHKEIFKSFTQSDATTARRYGGTGLGTTIAKDLTELMGGEIRLTSQVGVGSCFSVLISLPYTSQQPPRLLSHFKDYPFQKVLVVSPHEAVIEAVASQLEYWGFIVERLPDPKQILDVNYSTDAELLFWDYDLTSYTASRLFMEVKQISWLSKLKKIVMVPLTQAYNEEDNGGFITLAKPVKRESLFQTMMQAAGKTERAGSGLFHILVVDDSSTNRILLEHLLHEFHIEVTAAVNGLEAVKIYQEKSPNLILMDVNMPVMCGIEATEKIRELEKNSEDTIPIIGITASKDAMVRQEMLDSGMNSFVLKPINRADILEALREFLPVHGSIDPILSKTTTDSFLGIDGIDSEQAQQLWLDQSVYLEGLRSFVRKHKNDHDIFEQSLKLGDFQAILKKAHELKGAAGNIAAQGIMQAALDLEKAATLKNTTAVQASIQELLQKLTNLIREVEAIEEEKAEVPTVYDPRQSLIALNLAVESLEKGECLAAAEQVRQAQSFLYEKEFQVDFSVPLDLILDFEHQKALQLIGDIISKISVKISG